MWEGGGESPGGFFPDIYRSVEYKLVRERCDTILTAVIKSIYLVVTSCIPVNIYIASGNRIAIYRIKV